MVLMMQLTVMNQLTDDAKKQLTIYRNTFSFVNLLKWDLTVFKLICLQVKDQSF